MKAFKKAASALLAALIFTAALAGCNQNTSSVSVDDGTKTYQIGICQYASHTAMDDAVKGFKQALADKLGSRVTFTEKNGGADSAACVAACSEFVSQNVDLIFADGTTALQAAYAATDKTPIIGANVTDYAAALDFENSINVTGMNISGTSNLVSADDEAGMLHELFPDAKKVGLLYSADEIGSAVQAKALTAPLEGFGYEVRTFTFAGKDDVESTVKAACKSSDVLVIPNDSLAAVNAEAIQTVTAEKGVPVVVSDSGLLSSCGAVGLVPDAYALGYTSGEMAYDVLANGADISTMKIRTPDSVSKKYVADRCEALELEIPDSYTKAD